MHRIYFFILVITYTHCIPPNLVSTFKTTNDIAITSNEMNDRALDDSITINKGAMLSNTDLHAKVEIASNTAEVCSPDISNGINVINRTSSSFTALITYNCSSINSSKLFVFFNETEVDDCIITEESSNSAINVTCDHIQNNAGRDWVFIIASKHVYNKNILNETFIITLEPLSLETSTNITILVDDNLTSALVTILNCLDITDPEYLIFRCTSSDLLNDTLSDNCAYTCVDLNPGFIYEASLVRLPIPIADKGGYEHDNIFEEETLNVVYMTNLDKATNLTFQIANNTATIYFNPPRGDFDQINLTCSAQDQHCPNVTTILTNTTDNCTSISVSPIMRGVHYICQTLTIKQNFTDTPSEELNMITALEPVIYEKSDENWLFYTSHFVLDVTPRSDFDRLQSVCSFDHNLGYPCADFNITHDQCSTTLQHNGTLGCTYQCYIATKKLNYNEARSMNYEVELFPPKPYISEIKKESKYIFIRWEISELAYVNSSDVFLNHNRVDTVYGGQMFYDFLVLPNRVYYVRVLLNSNRPHSSDSVEVKTAEAAPKEPTNPEIESKIISNDNDGASVQTQHVIEIDRTLFTDDYGVLNNYSIYIRQDRNKNSPEPDSNGTYAGAWRNPSIDYLAIFLPRSSIINHLSKNDDKIRLLIGNETLCRSDSIPSIPCNGKLKPNMNYSLIVRACTHPGCTYVLSKSFRTKNENPPKGGGTSVIMWIVLPVLLVLVIVGLLIWKRKEIKSFYTNKTPKRMPEPSILLDDLIKSSGSRPKSLHEYINMTEEDERGICAEYQELETLAPRFCQSDHESDLNRYKSIPARGPWKRTAVYLTARQRRHDYINANIIISYDNKKQYIACQGPLKETCQDFWDMIIQFNVPKIVMLTRTEEQSRQNPSEMISKCYPYFPKDEGKTLKLGEILIKVLNVQCYDDDDLEIRYISVKDSCMEHRLIHYYYTGWSDFTVIEPKKLLDLIQKINSYERGSRKCDSSAPMVVHCSAGVGRTGTYIAVDTILRLLDRPNRELSSMKLNVMDIVHQLRRDRVKMVQTKEQYMLVNRCVEEHLKRTNRLDIVLNQSNYANLPNTSHPYENVPCRLSHSSEPYVNIHPLNDEKRHPPSPLYANLADQQSASNHSYSIAPGIDAQDTPAGSSTRRSTYVPSKNTDYRRTTSHNSRDHSQSRPPLPRRSISTQSSCKM